MHYDIRMLMYHYVSRCKHSITDQVKMFKHLDSLRDGTLPNITCTICRSTVTKLGLAEKALFQNYHSLTSLNNKNYIKNCFNLL